VARVQLFLKFAPLVLSHLFLSSTISAQTQGLFFTPPAYPLFVILPSSATTRAPYARWRRFSFAVLPALFAILTLLTPTVCAQTYIFGRADFAAGTEPSSVATGDFNGDGILDLVVTNSADDTISVLQGKADGTFEAQVAYPTGPRPNSVATGDFNGDGNLDLAVANENCILVAVGGMNQLQCSPSTVSIFLGNGDGTFRSKVDYSAGSGPSGVASADFNGDGKLDLAVVNYGDGTVSILLGNGDGTFQNQIVYADGGQGTVPQSQGSITIINWILR
jgi:VCBS repeat protein